MKVQDNIKIIRLLQLDLQYFHLLKPNTSTTMAANSTLNKHINQLEDNNQSNNHFWINKTSNPITNNLFHIMISSFSLSNNNIQIIIIIIIMIIISKIKNRNCFLNNSIISHNISNNCSNNHSNNVKYRLLTLLVSLKDSTFKISNLHMQSSQIPENHLFLQFQQIIITIFPLQTLCIKVAAITYRITQFHNQILSSRTSIRWSPIIYRITLTTNQDLALAVIKIIWDSKWMLSCKASNKNHNKSARMMASYKDYRTPLWMKSFRVKTLEIYHLVWG